MTDELKIKRKDNQPVDPKKAAIVRKIRTSMIFAVVWGLIIGAGGFFRLDDLGEYWQTTLITYNYLVSAVLFFIAVYMFWRGKTRLGKILSLLGFYPGMVAASVLQGGGSSLMILMVMGVAFTLTYAYLVEDKNSTNRFLFYSFGVVALSLGFMYIPVPFRYVAGPDAIGQAGVPITIATGIVALVLIIWNFNSSVNWFLNRPLRFKLILSMIVVVVIGSVALTVVQAIQSSDRLTESTSTALQNMADSQAEELGDLVASRLEMMSSLALSTSVIDYLQEQNAEFSEMSEASVLREMQRFDTSWENASDSSTLVRGKLTNGLASQAIELKSLAEGEFLEVFFTDKYGGLAATSDRTSDYYQADEGWWQIAYHDGFGSPYVGQMEFDESTGQFAVNLAVPVYDRDTREVIGIMRSTFDISSQLEAMDERGESIGDTAELEVLFANESHVHHGEVVPMTDEEHELTHEWTPEKVTLFWDGNDNYAGMSRVVSSELALIEELDWEILVTQDVAVISSSIQANVLSSIGIGFLVILVGGALAAFIGQTIATPVLTLTEVAKSFAGGDYNIRADIASEDEIGQLASAFNLMAEEVGTQTIALAERGREMEASQRVTFAASERTTPDDFLNLLVNLIADQFDVYHCQVYLVDEDTNRAVLSQSTGYAGRQLLQRGHAIPLDAQSLVTQCINTGEAVLVAETAKDPNWLPNPLLPYTQSELVVPLKVDDKVIGAMDIQDRVAERFTSETVPVFESMTEHVAFLYQNNELLEDIEEAQKLQQQFVSQLEAASEVAGQLTAILDPTQLLDQSVTMLQSRFNFYHAHIYLLDEAKENLVIASGSGNVGVILKDRGHSIPVTAEQSFVATAYRNAVPVRVGDTTTDPNWLPNPLLPDTRAEMAVPLITRGQVIGVLDIQDEVVDRFTEVDEDTMLTLAGQVATSVDTARLFIDAENAAERTETLYQVSNKLNTAQGMEEILQVVSGLAMENGAYSSTMMMVTTDENGEPEWAEIVASIDNSTANAASTVPVGTRFFLPDMPFTKMWIANQYDCQFVSDVEKDPNLDEASRAVTLQSGAKALTILPLSQGENWLGFITFNWDQPHEFSPMEKELFTAFIGLTSQVVASQRLQAEIRESQQRLSLLVQQSPVAVIEWDTQFEVVDWNPAAETIFGFAKEEAVGRHAAGLIIPEAAKAAVDEVWANLLTLKGGDRSTNENLTKDGRTITCEWFNTPLTNDAGEVFGVASLVLDITERQQAEKAIVQGDRLKSEFLANMSHELRTPLNSILGYTDVLLMGLDGDLDEEVTTDLEAIHENSQHLLNLINDILDLAKIEAGRMTIELGDVDVAELLAEVKKTSAGLLVNKEIEMVVDVKEKLQKIVADYHRVYQVINNLVSNSVKFTEKGEITLRAFAEGDEMVLQVEDTGIGISQEDLDEIFEEFTQADTSSTRQHEGTGLGLTITRRLVQMHGGKIEVTSELGKGSTFTVRLPFQAQVDPELLIVASSSNGNK
jgi:PAS domain S-box-containing protein